MTLLNYIVLLCIFKSLNPAFKLFVPILVGIFIWIIHLAVQYVDVDGKDEEEFVHCQDCKYYNGLYCDFWKATPVDKDYCSKGERKV